MFAAIRFADPGLLTREEILWHNVTACDRAGHTNLFACAAHALLEHSYNSAGGSDDEDDSAMTLRDLECELRRRNLRTRIVAVPIPATAAAAAAGTHYGLPGRPPSAASSRCEYTVLYVSEEDPQKVERLMRERCKTRSYKQNLKLLKRAGVPVAVGGADTPTASDAVEQSNDLLRREMRTTIVQYRDEERAACAEMLRGERLVGIAWVAPHDAHLETLRREHPDVRLAEVGKAGATCEPVLAYLSPAFKGFVSPLAFVVRRMDQEGQRACMIPVELDFAEARAPQTDGDPSAPV